MGYDLMVFEKTKAPTTKKEFLAYAINLDPQDEDEADIILLNKDILRRGNC